MQGRGNSPGSPDGQSAPATHTHTHTHTCNIWEILLTLRHWALLNNLNITFAIIHQTDTARGTEIVTGRMVHLWICLVCVRLSCFLSVMRSGQELEPQLSYIHHQNWVTHFYFSYATFHLGENPI